jgi:hypothetical protein
MVLSLGFYAARAMHLPRRTTLGTEQRLFGGTNYALLRHPATGRWLVSAQSPAVASTAPPPPTFWSTLTDALVAFRWPAGPDTGRTLTPFRGEGTWSLEPLGLRRVWRLSANAIKQDTRRRYLAVTDPPAVLDLATSRTYVNEAAQQRLAQLPDEDYPGEEYPTVDLDADDLLPLDGGNATSPRALNNNRGIEIGGRTVSLFWSDPPGPGTALYAASDHAAPRMLRLAAGAAYAHASPDGRTVFFIRDGALWRLNLRRPLPELLDEAVPPQLPEPVLDELPGDTTQRRR